MKVFQNYKRIIFKRLCKSLDKVDKCPMCDKSVGATHASPYGASGNFSGCSGKVYSDADMMFL